MTDSERTTAAEIDQAFKLLISGKEEKSKDLFHKYVSCMGHIDFHYSLYSLEEASYFCDEFLNPAKYRHGRSFSRIIRTEIKKADKKNTHETYELLQWSKRNEIGTHEKIRNSNSGMSLVQSLIAQGVQHDKRAVYKQALDAYKDKFEVEVYLVFLANLILIQSGHNFSTTPFKTHRLRTGGLEVHRGGHLKKGLAVTWLIENAQGSLKGLIRSCYVTGIRDLSGHHAYTINTRYRRIEADGENVSLREVFLRLRLLSSMHMALSLGASLALFEYDPQLGHELTNFGIKDWH